MRKAVLDGSARSLSANPMQIAGKTGTAQWSSNKPPHAWFTSFGPLDHPEIVVTILVEEAGEGSSVAIPLAKVIYEWWWIHHHS